MPETLDAPDLGFRTVGTDRARRLTKAEITRYNTFGFVQPFDIFDATEMAATRAYFDRLMSDLGERGAYGINCYQARLSGIWDIATDPRILDLVEDIAGPDFVCWASAVLSKAPRDPRQVPWHQDASFWKLSPARTVTVWLAIDDVDAGNAAMRFIPGTHDKGVIETSAMGADSVFHKGIADVERFGTPFTTYAGRRSGLAPCRHAGSRIGGEPLRRRRCGLTLRYCPTSVRNRDADWARGVEAIAVPRQRPRPGTGRITLAPATTTSGLRAARMSSATTEGPGHADHVVRPRVLQAYGQRGLLGHHRSLHARRRRLSADPGERGSRHHFIG